MLLSGTLAFLLYPGRLYYKLETEKPPGNPPQVPAHPVSPSSHFMSFLGFPQFEDKRVIPS